MYAHQSTSSSFLILSKSHYDQLFILSTRHDPERLHLQYINRWVTVTATHTQPVILVTGADLAPQAVEMLSEFEIQYAGARPNEADLIALVSKHDPIALIVRYGRITPAIIEAATSLRVISKHGSGIDTIDIAAAQTRGIKVCAASGANAAAVAEHTIALILACAKSIVTLDRRMHAGHWDKSTHKSLELEGRTLGLVGMGAIGKRVAAIAHAMGMKIIGFDPYAANNPEYIETVELNQIWQQSDVISLHCPLSDDNRNFMNTSVFDQCKDGVIIINTARGGLIHEQNLLSAIQSGKVASAGIDSFSQEPPAADHVFFNQPGLLLTPHIGGVTTDAYIKMGCGSAQNVLNALREQ